MTAAAIPAGPAPIVADLHQFELWQFQLSKLERLLAVASDHLGEDIPYVGRAVAGIDTVDALIDGAAALVRELAKELGRAEAPVAS